MSKKFVDSALKPYIQQLGKIPDQDIAAKAGVSRAVTVSYRKKLGISAYSGHRSRGTAKDNAVEAPADIATPVPTPVATVVVEAPETDRSFRGRRSALDVHAHLLGTMADADVARIAGVTPENVRTYRTRRGIEANWRGKQGASPAAPVVTPTPVVPAPVVPAPVVPAPVASVVVAASVKSLVAYEVTIEVSGASHCYVVAGSDIVAAARQAVAGVTRRHPGGILRSMERIADVLDR